MKIDELREEIANVASEYDTSTVLLDNPYFDKSILGYVEEDDTIRVVYDYNKMVNEFVDDSEGECNAIDAEEFIGFNTIRAIPYMGKSAPLIVHSFNC